MRTLTVCLLLLATCSSVMAAPGGLRVELYRVSILNDDADISIDTGAVLESERIASGANNDFGVRFLAWAPASPLAGGIDIGALSTRETSGPMLDANVSWLAFFAGLRAQEPWFARNGHGVHPYALMGLSLVDAKGSIRTQTLNSYFNSNDGFGLSPSKPADVAPYLAAGFEWNPFDNLAVTVDYRVQRFNVDTNVFLSNDRVSFDLDASGIGIGLAWRTAPHGAR